MKTFVNRRSGLGLDRIAHYLIRYMPKDDILVDSIQDADLVILFVDGRLEHNKALADSLSANGQQYAIFQIAIKSTRNPNPEDWIDLWKKAKLVWSYYPLEGDFNFYHSPLGADKDIFKPLYINKNYICGMTGNDARAECHWEVEKAARSAGLQSLHIQGVDDEKLNYQYNQCVYISGLRTKEGFEMPAIEGMLAGARPVVFDTPIFRQWYDGLAEFIPEGDRYKTVQHLTKLFVKQPRPVTGKEIGCVQFMFDWERIISGFWERCHG